MAKCLVCGKETACGECKGSGRLDDPWAGDTSCFACIGHAGLSHTHPRKERNQARRELVDATRIRERDRHGDTGGKAFRYRRLPPNKLSNGGACRYGLWMDMLLRAVHGKWTVKAEHQRRLAHLRDRTMRDAFDKMDGVQ